MRSSVAVTRVGLVWLQHASRGEEDAYSTVDSHVAENLERELKVLVWRRDVQTQIEVETSHTSCQPSTSLAQALEHEGIAAES